MTQRHTPSFDGALAALIRIAERVTRRLVPAAPAGRPAAARSSSGITCKVRS